MLHMLTIFYNVQGINTSGTSINYNKYLVEDPLAAINFDNIDNVFLNFNAI